MRTAFFGEPELKAKVMDRLREDRRLDRISQGIYWDDSKGCHLGCLTRCGESQSPHEATERMFGIPVKVAYWLEAVFEGLPEEDCEWWVIEGTNAIPVGADLSLAHHKFASWLLGPGSPSANGNQNELVAKAVQEIRFLHDLSADGGVVTEQQWSAARSAARKDIANKSIEIFSNSPVAECEDCESCFTSTMNYLNSPVVI